MWDFLRSTQSSRYFSIIGSWIFCHVRCFLLLMTSYKASSARCALPTSMNSVEINKNKIMSKESQSGYYTEISSQLHHASSCTLIELQEAEVHAQKIRGKKKEGWYSLNRQYFLSVHKQHFHQKKKKISDDLSWINLSLMTMIDTLR